MVGRILLFVLAFILALESFSLLYQYLGGSLLKLPEEQEELGPPLAAQILRQLVQGERS